MTEVWRQVPSLPEYLASSFGRLMRVPWIGKMPHGGVKHYGGQPTFGVWHTKERRFSLQYKGKNYKVAPLICEAFNGSKPFPSAVCMHMDEDSENNVPTNLEWGTQKDNLNAPRFLKYCQKRRGDRSPTAVHRRRTKKLRCDI